MIDVFVTDGEQRAALAVVRALGRAGHRVIVCSARRRCLAGASRYASSSFVTPDPRRDASGFRASIAQRAGGALAIPITDAAALALLAPGEDLASVTIPMPPLEVYRAVADKACVLEAARGVGICAPEQQVLRSETEAKGIGARVSFPVVVKPSRPVVPYVDDRHTAGVRYAANEDALLATLRRYPRAAYPLLLQQRIVGRGVGIFLLRWGGRTLASFAHRRIREKPPTGGVSVNRESIPADPDLVARSTALLDRFRWRGVAMVEYKLDALSGTPYLMEINGRFWGSLQLAVDAGVDFPNLLVTAALGQDVVPVTSYRVGVRVRWEWGEVDHLLARLRRRKHLNSLPPDAPSRWRTVRDFLAWHRGDHPEVLRWDDPRPFLRETIDWFRGR